MLYIGQNEWTHVNCALWSAEVFEDDDGSLKNVHMAVIRGKQLVRSRECHPRGSLCFQMCCLWLGAASCCFPYAFGVASKDPVLVSTASSWLS